MNRCRALLTVAALVLCLGVRLAVAEDPPKHPLVRQWDDQFKDQYATGDYALSVTSVDGDKVTGTVRPGGNCPYCGEDISFTGRVSKDGDGLTFNGVTPINTAFQGELGRKGDDLIGWPSLLPRTDQVIE